MIENGIGNLSAVALAIFANFTKTSAERPAVQFSEVRNCTFFDLLPDEYLARLSDLAEIRRFRSGTCIVKESTPETLFIVVLSGIASAQANGMSVGVIQRGECIGENVFLGDQSSSSASIVANGDLVAFVLPKEVVGRLSGELRDYTNKALQQAQFKKQQRLSILRELQYKQRNASPWRHA